MQTADLPHRPRPVGRRADAVQARQHHRSCLHRPGLCKRLGLRGKVACSGAGQPGRPIQRCGGRHHDAHRQERIGCGMGAGQDRHLWPGMERAIHQTGHGRGANGHHRLARPCRPRAEGGAHVVARPRRDRRAGTHPPTLCQSGAQATCRCPALHQRRQMGRVPTCGAAQRGIPLAGAAIEELRAPGIRRLRRDLAGQGQPDIILGQQQHPGAGHQPRFMAGQPHQLWRGDAGVRRAVGSLADIGDGGQQFHAFCKRALVVPKHRGAKRAEVGVKDQCRQHLPGEADPGHRAHRRRMCGGQVVKAGPDGGDPQIGVLF